MSDCSKEATSSDDGTYSGEEQLRLQKAAVELLVMYSCSFRLYVQQRRCARLPTGCLVLMPARWHCAA